MTCRTGESLLHSTLSRNFLTAVKNEVSASRMNIPRLFACDCVQAEIKSMTDSVVTRLLASGKSVSSNIVVTNSLTPDRGVYNLLWMRYVHGGMSGCQASFVFALLVQRFLLDRDKSRISFWKRWKGGGGLFKESFSFPDLRKKEKWLGTSFLVC